MSIDTESLPSTHDSELGPIDQAQADFRAGFPVLRHIHKTSKQFILDDALLFDDSRQVLIENYYMGRTDPPELGLWKLTGYPRKDDVSRLQSIPGKEQVFSMTVGEPGQPPRNATDEEMVPLAASLLRVAQTEAFQRIVTEGNNSLQSAA